MNAPHTIAQIRALLDDLETLYQGTGNAESRAQQAEEAASVLVDEAALLEAGIAAAILDDAGLVQLTNHSVDDEGQPILTRWTDERAIFRD